LCLASTLASNLDYRLVQLTNGITLQVGTAGASSTGKVSLVFLHGFPEGSASWSDLVPLFDTNTYYLVVPDLRGYNKSTILSGRTNYNSTDIARDVSLLIKQLLPARKVFLIGHDWGGPIAWIVGALYSELLAGLVVMDGPHPNVFANLLRTDPEQQRRSQYILFFNTAASTEYMTQQNYKNLIASLGPWVHGREQFYIDSYRHPGCVDAMINWYRANIYGSLVFDSKMQFNFPGNITIPASVPTLVLWGTDDGAFHTDANLDGLKTYVRRLTVQKFEKTGHWIAHERATEVAAAIRKFITG